METLGKINYPVYRKYKNNKAFFKIVAADEFEEIQLIGKVYAMHKIVAKILPERNLLHDMIFDFKDNWLEIQAEEYETVKDHCTGKLKKL